GSSRGDLKAGWFPEGPHLPRTEASQATSLTTPSSRWRILSDHGCGTRIRRDPTKSGDTEEVSSPSPRGPSQWLTPQSVSRFAVGRESGTYPDRNRQFAHSSSYASIVEIHQFIAVSTPRPGSRRQPSLRRVTLAVAGPPSSNAWEYDKCLSHLAWTRV